MSWLWYLTLRNLFFLYPSPFQVNSRLERFGYDCVVALPNVVFS